MTREIWSTRETSAITNSSVKGELIRPVVHARLYIAPIIRFGETPTPEQVNEFKRVCSHYFEQNPGEIVGKIPPRELLPTSKTYVHACPPTALASTYRCPLHSWLQPYWLPNHILPGRGGGLEVSSVPISLASAVYSEPNLPVTTCSVFHCFSLEASLAAFIEVSGQLNQFALTQIQNHTY